MTWGHGLRRRPASSRPSLQTSPESLSHLDRRRMLTEGREADQFPTLCYVPQRKLKLEGFLNESLFRLCRS